MYFHKYFIGLFLYNFREFVVELAPTRRLLLNIEVAECHQLCWLLGRTTGCRPGSIRAPKVTKRKDLMSDTGLMFLTWRDLVLHKMARGKWFCDIVFRIVQTNVNKEDAGKRQSPRVAIRLRIMPPEQVENLLFSVPHRLLVMMLRHSLLDDIHTVQELMDSTLTEVRVREEALDLLVVFRSKRKGVRLSNEPLMARSIIEYLGLHGKHVGFTEPIMRYSIRRGAARTLSASWVRRLDILWAMIRNRQRLNRRTLTAGQQQTSPPQRSVNPRQLIWRHHGLPPPWQQFELKPT
jgi:hypothetical protein